MQPTEPSSLDTVLTVTQYVVLMPLLFTGVLAVWRVIRDFVRRTRKPARDLTQ